MTTRKLQNPEALREACEVFGRELANDPGGTTWLNQVAEFIEWFRSADENERADKDFQRRLWDENPVSAPGQGTIDVTPVIQETDFRVWLAQELGRKFEDDKTARRKHIEGIMKRLRAVFQQHLPRVPQLKMLRVMAIAYPNDFTTVADGRRVKAIYRELFGGRAKKPVLCNFAIMDRLEEVLGPAKPEARELAKRMILPWGLYAQHVLGSDDEATEEIVSTGGDTKLIPMPAARRRRGLTVIANGMQTILGALDFIEDGVGKDELIVHLRTLLPNYKDSSLNVTIGVLTSELGLVKREDGGLLVLTDRGQAFLESQDPSELSDWLLTRVLGLDMALVKLRDDGSQSRAALLATIRKCNPGLTSNFAPSAMLSWMKSFGLIQDEDGAWGLTDVGQQWAARIHWEPPVLQAEAAAEALTTLSDIGDVSAEEIELPEVGAIISSIQSKWHFDARMIQNLHAGLWGNNQRHFAVLTGLSGTGKTLLAREYGKALRPDGGIHRISVQPGWYDAAAILGYVNPLRPDEYVRTGFLEFLMEAIDQPNLPFIVILDEMNLSHPEQYLAPILASMEEAGGTIDLHQEGDDFDGIPQRLPYPRNLVVLGTVNMDETTHGLSDKVLDRAFTVEFWDVEVDAFPDWNKHGLDSDIVDKTSRLLNELYSALRPARMHFGWRTIADVLGFLRVRRTSVAEGDLAISLDDVVYAKILPKLRGDDSPRFRTAIDETEALLARHELPRSAERVKELRQDLSATGTARFWR